jgi:pimeloyl-ACP methyl ester carboxylesterase
MRFAVDGSEVYAYTGSRALDAARSTMVFVHGAANDHSVWALQSRYFAHHGRNVLALDLPGHGRSGGAPLPSVESIAQWLVRVLDAIEVPRAALVGHSMGALVVLQAAGASPDRVERVALLGPAVPMAVSDALLDAACADDHLAYELIVGWSHSAGKQLGGNRVPGLWMTGSALRLMERSTSGTLACDLAACGDYAAGLDAAARVRCPSLVVIGARDLMAPPKSAEVLVQTLRGSRVVTLPECGHAIMAEEPDAVLDALRAWMR